MNLEAITLRRKISELVSGWIQAPYPTPSRFKSSKKIVLQERKTVLDVPENEFAQ